jgi:hypothetical protein
MEVKIPREQKTPRKTSQRFKSHPKKGRKEGIDPNKNRKNRTNKKLAGQDM